MHKEKSCEVCLSMSDQRKSHVVVKPFKTDPISYKLHRIILMSPKQKR